MSDLPTPIRCELCGKEIEEIAGVDGYFVKDLPAILHGKCYREISEKAWMYDNLDK